jgi:hypothetical protein
MASCRPTLRGLLLAAAVAVPAAAHAVPTREERATARMHYDKAVTHYNLGEFADAAAEFRAVYKAAPQAALLFDAAQAYRLANDVPKAVFFYQSYLRVEPGTPRRAEVEKRIKELSPASPPTTPAPLTPPAEKLPGVPAPAETHPSSPDAPPSPATRAAEKKPAAPETKPEKTPSAPDDKPEGATKPTPADSKAQASSVGTGGSERLKPVVDLIRKNRAGFRGCFDRWADKHPGVGGTVTLSFYLDPDGNLDQADADAKGFDAPEVLDCIIGYAHSLHYPPSPNGKFTRFTYPFDFKAAR